MSGTKYLRLGPALAIIVALLLSAACGGSSSPTSPSSPSNLSPGGSSGAKISGTVSGTTSGSSSGYSPLGGSGITITIAGTGITTSADANGNFQLTGVPAGTVQLVITSGSGTATITLDGVQATDTIKIKITVKGMTATLDTEERNGQPATEIEDRIASINPEGTTRTLLVGSARVSVPEAAAIRHGGTVVEFTALKVGDRVHVRGSLSGALFVATQVMVQNTNEKVPVNVSGAVSSMEAGHACPAVRFVVGGWTVETDAKTDFRKVACGAITIGTGVHVKGDVQSSGRVLATSVQG